VGCAQALALWETRRSCGKLQIARGLVSKQPPVGKEDRSYDRRLALQHVKTRLWWKTAVIGGLISDGKYAVFRFETKAKLGRAAVFHVEHPRA